MKFPLWLTTSVIAWGVLIPTKAQSQVVLDLSEPSSLSEENNLSEQNTEVHTLAKGFHRRFGKSRHGHFRRGRRSRHRGHRGHDRHRRDQRGHFNHRRDRHRGSSGIFFKF